ncbi:hypothetical protein F9278_16505 [Streptomyces phaeolivaceus]|uniref:Uncharacterized protein n=1 Tax=Streptomyces phaeolivaceus TaxID=2653200 RepID=A0A5P8K342_9ACTN|nr:hypothetical protein F9278_16505 [Streptomyces phaeolivaceus]
MRGASAGAGPVGLLARFPAPLKKQGLRPVLFRPERAVGPQGARGTARPALTGPALEPRSATHHR